MPEAIFECCNKITNSYNKFDVNVQVLYEMTIGH